MAKRYLFMLLMGLFSCSCLKGVSHPKPSPPLPGINNVPWADDTKLVRKIFSLTIPGAHGAYNPSIVKFQDGYLLSFRYDDKHLKKSLVGLVRLDKKFKIIGTPVIADSTLEHQDVRLFWYKGGLFAASCRIISMHPPQCPIALSQVDLKTLTFQKVVDLNYHPQIIEKNWVPVVYKDNSAEETLYFIYSHNPLHILRLTSFDLGTVEQAFPLQEERELEWEKKWGKIRGGTPCLPLGDEQIAFFHSAFFDGLRWCWVVGAMTLENFPPFSITKISPYPIVPRGMYSTPVAHRFKDRPFRVAFPGGVVEAKEGEEALFYVVYGENDSGIKVMVLDKERVLASLKNFNGPPTIPNEGENAISSSDKRTVLHG